MSSDHQETGNRRPSSRNRSSRPTTPLRPSSRSSFRDSAREAGDGEAPFPLNALEPAFAELSDGMADLEANMMHFQIMHESLARFSESFASFLYGLNMNAFCVDFPEAPISESFKRDRDVEEPAPPKVENEGETTFMTTDISFVENPPTSSKPRATASSTTSRQSRLPSARGTAARGRAGSRGRARPSGLARPSSRGVR